jgi:non-specific serine/threonine protein kinase
VSDAVRAEPSEPPIGRDEAIEAVMACLMEPSTTLVTVTGLPGVGKSTVAAEVAARLGDEVVWVDHLDAPGRSLATRIQARQRRSPSARMLATAPGALGIEGERVVPLPPLPVPPTGVTDPEELLAVPSVELFLRRARETDLAFAPRADDLRAVAEICRLLDGLPGAITMVASQVALLDPAALVELVGRRSAWDLVDADPTDHVRTVIASLAAAPMAVLTALATFAGEVTVDAVEAVSDVGDLPTTIDLLRGLADLHLVRADAAHGRFAILSCARPLVEVPREMHERHARHFAERARARSIAEADLPDALQALGWLRSNGDVGEVLRLAVELTAAYLGRGEPATARALLLECLALASGGAAPATKVEAHLAVVRLAWEGTGVLDRTGAAAHLAAARQLAEEIGDRALLMRVLSAACERHILSGAFDAATEVAWSGLGLCVGPDDDASRANFLGWLAVIAHQSGAPQQAESFVWEALRLALPLGDRALVDRTCAIYWGLPDRVRSHDLDVPSLTELIELAHRAGDARGAAWLLTIAMGAALDRDDIDGAVTWCLSGIELARRTGNVPFACQVLAAVLRLAAKVERWETAALLEGALVRDAMTVTARIPPHTVAALRGATRRAREVLSVTRRQTLFARGHRLTVAEALSAGEVLLEEVAASSPTPLSDGLVPAAEADADEADLTLLATLTPRERTVLGQLVLGRSNKEAAEELGLTAKTVMHHCASIYRKLGVAGRTAAVSVVLRAEAR